MSKSDNRNSGAKTESRNADRTFSPGKPNGSRHRGTQAIEAMLEGPQEALTRAAIDKALEDDVTALRRCLGRIAPVSRYAATEGADGTVEKIAPDRRLYRYTAIVM